MQPRNLTTQESGPRATSPAWRLELLGGAALHGIAVRHRLERKTAGVLALLALEGERTRSNVAGLLWPDTDEERARANLRQCLHRLKKLSGTDLVQSTEPLALTAELEVDTVTLESRAFLGDDAGLIAVRGEILERFDFEDCPEFQEWLEAQRQRWREARGAAYRRALQHLDAPDALEWARDWTNLEPLSEEAHRALARVWAVRGDRARAVKLLRDLETLLRRELGASVSPETRALREALERDAEAERPAPAPVLPLDVLNPPRLIGRERVWARLERAWAAGQGIVIRGLPGVGKTRLMLDFLASKTRFDLLQARPGDESVAYATMARSLRQTLGPDALIGLPAWVRGELTRLIPEFADTLPGDAVPGAMTSEADKLRFFEALFTVSQRRFGAGVQAIAIDDLQFIDASSFEAAQFNTERLNALGVRTITAYRQGELAPELEAGIERAAAAGLTQIIDLEPLEPPDLEALLASLHLDVSAGLAARLQQSTGGNPLFMLETLRDLLEQGALRADFEPLPLPQRVRQITAQRLLRRSPEAQRLAQVAAVALEDFSLELAAAVLETKPLMLQEALEELEAAQIMRGERFGHDLLAEAALAGIGAGLRRFLHRRCAEYLEPHSDPARVAAHWLAGGDPARAVPLLLRAGEAARARFELQATSDAFGRAGALLEALGQPGQAFEAYQRQVEAMAYFDLGDPYEALVGKLLEMAGAADEQAAAWIYRAKLLYQRGQGVEAEVAARRALQYSEAVEDQRYRLGALDCLMNAVFIQPRRTLEVVEIARQARAVAEGLGAHDEMAQYDSSLGVLLGRLDRENEALEYHRSAVAAFRRGGNLPMLVGGLSNLGSSLSDVGFDPEALRVLNEARDLLERLPDNLDARLHLALNRLAVLTSMAHFIEALETSETAQRLAVSYPSEITSNLSRLRCRLLLRLGALPEARAVAQGILENPQARVGIRVYALLDSAAICAALENSAETLATLDEAEALVRSSVDRPLARVRVQLPRVPHLEPEAGLALARDLQTALASSEHHAMKLSAQMRLVQCQLRLGRSREAVLESRAMMEVFERVNPELVYRAEVMLTHARALAAADEPDARQGLERAATWLRETTALHVPPEYRAPFLSANPVNRAILDLARAAGFEPAPGDGSSR